MKTLIVDIKRNALDDGPGVRTLIFFKGCPLSCVWCQNPESKSHQREISFEREKCLFCHSCSDVCDQDAINSDKIYPINSEACNLCGECVEACKGGALRFVGNKYSEEKLLTIILKDKIFYDNSGGGVTFTGGEPTLNMEYLHSLLKKLKEENIHTCLETCGFYDREKFQNMLLPYLDLIYYDLKIYNDDQHKRYCKKSNELILKNFECLIRQKKIEILPRIPLIPGITDTAENLLDLAGYLKSNNIKKIALLPYNPLWISKTNTLGIKTEYHHDQWISRKLKEKIMDYFTDFEVQDFY